MRVLPLILLVSLCAWSPGALAAFQNRQLYPLGDREMLMGNTGAAGNPSLGAIYFNPANLAMVKHASLSLTGTTYLHMSSEISPLAKADNTSLDYTSSGFDTIPTMVASAWRVGNSTLAFGLLVPDYLHLENRQTFTTPNTQTTLDQIQSTRDLWLAVSWGGYLGEGFSIGATVFGMQHSDSSSLILNTRATNLANTVSVSQLRLQANVLSLSGTLGVRWDPLPFLSFGLRLQSRAFRLSGKADGYRYTQSVSSGNVTVDEQNQPGITTSHPLPTDGTLGMRLKINDVNFLFDVSMQEGLSYDLYPGSQFSVVERLSLAVRYNFGMEFEISPQFSMCAGFFLNPSAIPNLVDRPEGTISQTFYGGTGGITFLSGRVRTAIGLYVTKSLGDVVPYGDPTGRGVISQTGVGGTIVLSYYL